MGISTGERDTSYGDGFAPSRPKSSHLEYCKRRSVPGGFTGTKYTGHTGHKRLQSAMIVGTKINSIGCLDEDLKGKTSHSIKNQRVKGKLKNH